MPRSVSPKKQQVMRPTPLPLGALAAGVGLSLLSSVSMAQSQESAPPESTLPAVTVTDKAEHKPEAKSTYQATTTTIGKGKQALRDIPQSITVVTEKLIVDRNLDTMKDVLRQTAGITFMAAEGGEEDIRLRGFSLQQTGDIFLDGVRDPAIYDRDTFNLDRLELLRGSASMLFGRGSTGGAVNQVTKAPYLEQANEVSITGGSHSYVRGTGDFNIVTGEDAALRINAMRTTANNNGAGASIDKEGLALAYRTGIGKKVEHQFSLYYINNDNGINYGMPWIKPSASQPAGYNTVNDKLDPARYYGMSSDYAHSQGKVLSYTNTLKLGGGAELKSVIRKGEFERDQRAGTVRFASGTTDLSNFSDATVLNRGTQLKIQEMDIIQAQSDYTGKHQILGLKNEITTGIDLSREKRRVYGAKSAAQGGVTLTKPTTTVGTPDDGAWVDESSRILGLNNKFTATGAGVYLQDLVHIAPMWKVLGGLRYDFFTGDYKTYNLGTGAQTANYHQSINKLSKRVGVLFQPNALQSFHFSYGTSFNTSGDTYSYSPLSVSVPPESSQNLELGAKLDSEDGRVSTRVALFRATKMHERNTDVDSAATQYELSGKRHAMGIDIDVTGQITEEWEIYGSYTWIPEAEIDEKSATSFGNRKGDRPGLTPRHSGTIWNTYKFLPKWRAGLGLNFRSKQAPADIGTNNGGQQFYAPGYGTVDLMAEYTPNQAYAIKANVTNIANKLYADQVYRGHYVPGAGRLVQVTLTAKF